MCVTHTQKNEVTTCNLQLKGKRYSQTVVLETRIKCENNIRKILSTKYTSQTERSARGKTFIDTSKITDAERKQAKISIEERLSRRRQWRQTLN